MSEYQELLSTCRTHTHAEVEHEGDHGFTVTATPGTSFEYLLVRTSEEYDDVCQEAPGVFVVYRTTQGNIYSPPDRVLE